MIEWYIGTVVEHIAWSISSPSPNSLISSLDLVEVCEAFVATCCIIVIAYLDIELAEVACTLPAGDRAVDDISLTNI